MKNEGRLLRLDLTETGADVRTCNWLTTGHGGSMSRGRSCDKGGSATTTMSFESIPRAIAAAARATARPLDAVKPESDNLIQRGSVSPGEFTVKDSEMTKDARRVWAMA